MTEILLAYPSAQVPVEAVIGPPIAGAVDAINIPDTCASDLEAANSPPVVTYGVRLVAGLDEHEGDEKLGSHRPTDSRAAMTSA